MDSDDEDYVFYGTPIEREEGVSSRKKKAVAEAAGQLRSLPSWKQEVRDEEGRRRFHGAFTGGFAAGYYNTVGSKEGWAPQKFTSSRKNRAELKPQSILNFLDDDEKAEMESHSLGISLQFDTFGFTAAELARKQVEKEQQNRPSAIPGPVPDEIILPATDSMGVKLLLKMGWRHGRSIKDVQNMNSDARRQARKAFIALSSDHTKESLAQSETYNSDHESVLEQSAEDDIHASQSTPVYVLNPKQDLHGLGYDPYKNAPEFREKKRLRVSGPKEAGDRKSGLVQDNYFGFKSGKVAPGFGIGALEELDTEDEDIYAPGFHLEETYVQEIDEPQRLSSNSDKKLLKNEQGVLPGFKVASNADYQLERFEPPIIPVGFEPYHKFPSPLETEYKLADPPPEVPPPEDNNLKLLIEGFASLVARCGKLFEDLSREKNKTNQLFCFLTGGSGHEYYTRKLWEEQQKRSDQKKQQMDAKSIPSVQKLTAESRGRILGERPLERSSKESSLPAASADAIQLQYNLSDTFTKPASLSEFPEVAKPFKNDPAKQERFEQFLRQKYHGGLRSTDSGGASHMSEAARARERLDFEAAVEAIEKAGWSKEAKISSVQSFMEISAAEKLQFTSGGAEQVKDSKGEDPIMKKMYPKREEYQWRPATILCKRFDIIDPYMGKPPPAPRMRSKMDALIFTSDSLKTTKANEITVANREPLHISQAESHEIIEDTTSGEHRLESTVTNIERPIDLYKAIFSDDSDDEVDKNQVEDQQKQTDTANTTLNRLIAGDFLESLGKELGLQVPPDPPYSINKSNDVVSQRESMSSFTDVNIQEVDVKPSSTHQNFNGPSKSQETAHDLLSHQNVTPDVSSIGNGIPIGKTGSSCNRAVVTGNSEDNSDNALLEKVTQEHKKGGKHSGLRRHSSGSDSSEDKTGRNLRRHRSRSSSVSSEDERRRKRHRRQQMRNSTSNSDVSDDHGNQDHSRPKRRKSSRGKSSTSSRKHSKHHKNGKDSSSRSSHHRTYRDTVRIKRDKKSRDGGRDPDSSRRDSQHNKHR